MEEYNVGIISKQQKMHYKETDPMDTVNRIRNILNELGIETVEDWQPVSSVGTHSLRLTVKGAKFGTNGKGVSKEFALASVYAEFLERLQNGVIDMGNPFSNDLAGFRHNIDEKIMSALQIAELDNAVMNRFFKSRGLENATVVEKASAYSSADQLEYYIYGVSDKREVKCYYNITKKCIDYIPFMIHFQGYASNGMCAGNSAQEAIIQGLSEILERYVQKQMMLRSLSFPDVPDEVIARYPYVYEMYKKAKEIPGYRVSIKDCSMGGKFPVAALFITKINSGRFGLKFGAHPDFGIAMERALTESSQGMRIEDYAKGSILDFYNTDIDSNMNIYNSYKFGHAHYPYQITGGKEDFAYSPVMDASKMENTEILNHMIKSIEELGYEIWIRDVSYTGFPSYHVIIPGMSELFEADDTAMRALNSRIYLAKYINKPELIDKKVAKYLIGTLEYWSSSFIDNKMRSLSGYDFNHNYPGEEIDLGWLHMSAMCYAFLGDYKNAANRMKKLYDTASVYSLMRDGVPVETYGATYNYLSAMVKIGRHESVMEYIRGMYDDKISSYLDNVFCEQSGIMAKQYPSHDYADKENCLKNHCCDYYIMLDVNEKLKNLQKTNPINQLDVAHLFAQH